MTPVSAGLNVHTSTLKTDVACSSNYMVSQPINLALNNNRSENIKAYFPHVTTRCLEIPFFLSEITKKEM
jgi:hypothetical protein